MTRISIPFNRVHAAVFAVCTVPAPVTLSVMAEVAAVPSQDRTSGEHLLVLLREDIEARLTSEGV